MQQATTITADERPTWRRIVDFPLVAMLIAAVLFLLVTGLATALGRLIHLQPPNLQMIVRDAIVLGAALLLYKFALVRLGEHPRDDLPAKGALPQFGLGLLAGFLIMTAIVGVAALDHIYAIIGRGSSDQLVHELVATAIMPGFMEEIFFRGILFRWLEEFGGSWVALLLTSALFGAAHLANPHASPVAAFAIAIEAGVLLGGAYMLTRGLWLPIGLHAAWNFTQGEVFDVPVSGLDEHGLVQAKLSGPALLSGGGFGLEASLFAMIVATIVGIWFVYAAVRRGQLVAPWWVRRRRALSAAAA